MPVSAIEPSSTTIILSTLRQRANLCVTTIAVFPFISSIIASRTSCSESGSRAEVGSSKRIISLSAQAQRIRASLCHWPPDKSSPPSNCLVSRVLGSNIEFAIGKHLQSSSNLKVSILNSSFSVLKESGSSLNCSAISEIAAFSSNVIGKRAKSW